MNTEHKIEEKVAIAADTAETVASYLEELSTKLHQASIPNPYNIVAETEEMIIDALRSLGKSTKIGTKEAMEIIHKQFGTPDQFVEIYRNSDEGETSLEYQSSGSPFHTDTDSMRLQKKRRRIRKQKIRKVKKEKPSYIKNILPYLPSSLLLISTILLIIGPEIGYTSSLINIIVLMTSAAALFIIQEIITGGSGKLLVSYGRSVKLRYSFRAIYILNYLVIVALYRGPMRSWGSHYILEQAYTILGITFLIYEAAIFMRDHFNNFFPLEDKFRPFVRFFTPPYILLTLAIIFGNPYYHHDSFFYFVTLIFSVVAGLWARYRKYPVSYRFYAILISIQVNAIISFDDLFLFITVLPIYMIIERLSLKRPRMPQLPKTPKILNRVISAYRDYYDTEVKK